ncbi:MAG: hypothetical protein E6G31_08535 [Actinobacteria bacterium]|nr:MAG: hypothetical protein E6G31_08535 [Actinomycetota bacterium]
MPKNGLESALSAQICSLSENVVPDCREMMTGGIHASLSFPAAAATSSVRETPIASYPLKRASSRVVPKLAVRFA